MSFFHCSSRGVVLPWFSCWVLKVYLQRVLSSAGQPSPEGALLSSFAVSGMLVGMRSPSLILSSDMAMGGKAGEGSGARV